MAQRVRVDIICDIHNDDGEEVMATQDQILTVGGRQYQLQWCDECDKQIVQATLSETINWFIEHAHKPSAAPSLPGSPNATRSAASHRAAAAAALRRERHGSGRESTWANNDQPHQEYKCSFPGCYEPPYRSKYYYDAHVLSHTQPPGVVCDVPGCNRGADGGPAVFYTTQQMGMHKFRAHGVAGPNSEQHARQAARKAKQDQA